MLEAIHTFHNLRKDKRSEIKKVSFRSDKREVKSYRTVD